MGAIRNRALENLAESLTLPCSNGDCKECVPYLEMADHRSNTCDFRKIVCQECGWEGPYTEFVEHCTENHEDAISFHTEDIGDGQVIGGTLLDLVEGGKISCCAYTELYKVEGAFFLVDWALGDSYDALTCAILFIGPAAHRLNYRWEIKVAGKYGSIVASGVPLACQVMDKKYDALGTMRNAICAIPKSAIADAMEDSIQSKENGNFKFDLMFSKVA